MWIAGVYSRAGSESRERVTCRPPGNPHQHNVRTLFGRQDSSVQLEVVHEPCVYLDLPSLDRLTERPIRL